MTQEEFFAYANLDNHSGDVNIWYTGSNPSTILGITVPVNSNVNGSVVNISAQLAQVQQITIPQPSGYQIIVEVNTRSLNESPNGTRYYLFLVNEISTTGITGGSAVGGIYLSPDINAYEFSVSPYNVLGGSVEDNRESNYIMKADKSTAGSTTVPTGYSGPANIYALLSGSAEIAVTQDSNYSLTGWSNARYNGTKTDIYDYQSPPLLSGTVFQGSNYPTTVPISQIKNQISSSTVIYSDYFYAGAEDTPGYSRKPLLYVTSGSSVPSSSTEFFIRTSILNPNNLTGSISVGDLIQIGGFDEIMRISLLGVPPGSAPGTLRVRAGRNINRTADIAPVGSDGWGLYRINPVQLYELESNRLNGVVKGYMVVRDTGAILTLDSNGFVIKEE
jgi:hypothetical protein